MRYICCGEIFINKETKRSHVVKHIYNGDHGQYGQSFIGYTNDNVMVVLETFRLTNSGTQYSEQHINVGTLFAEYEKLK